MFELTTLGDVSVRYNGGNISFPLRGALVLVLLADARNHALKKDHIVSLLWPNAVLHRGQHSLNQTLHTVRRLTGTAAFDASGSHVRLTAPVQWDYSEVVKRLGEGNTVGACALVHGELLSGVRITNGEAFEEWRYQRSTLLNSRLLRALVTDIAAAERRQSWLTVRTLADEGQRLYSSAVDVRLAGIRALIALGLKDDAERAYLLLLAELDADDTCNCTRPPSLSQLEADVNRIQLFTAAPTRLAFVGRVNELRELAQHLAAATAGSGNVVTVSGTAGIGKTTLCAAFIDRAQLQGVKVISAAAYSTERHIGYNVLAEALRSAVPEINLDVLPAMLRPVITELIPDLDLGTAAIDAPQLGHEAARWRLFEAVSRLFLAMATQQTVVLFFDDIHWADDATLTWLSSFVRRIGSARIMVLVTTRTEERARLIVSNRTDPKLAPAYDIPLTELNRRDTIAIVHALKPEWNDEVLINALIRNTGGHPLLITEALKETTRERAMSPGALRTTYLVDQLQLLPQEHRVLLEWLAIAGTPLSPGVIESMTRLPVAKLGEDLDRLAGFCTVVEGNFLAFRHELVRESIYHSITPDKRIVLHAELGRVLERENAQPSVLAHHFEKAGLKVQTARHALEAAANSEVAHAFKEAEHFYRLALAAMGDQADTTDILARLGAMLFQSGAYTRAIPVLAELATRYNNDTRTHLDWEWKHLSAIRLAAAMDDQALLDRARALEELANVHLHPEALFSALEVQIAVCFSSYTIRTNDLPPLNEAMISLAQRYPVTPVGTRALATAGHLMALTVNAHTALRYNRQALEWADRLKIPELQLHATRALGLVLYLTGSIPEAKITIERGIEMIDVTGAVSYKADLYAVLGCVLTELDAEEETKKCFSQVDNVNPDWDIAGYLGLLSNRALFELDMGNALDALATTTKFLEVNTSNLWAELPTRGVRGLAYLNLGRIREAFAESDRLEPLVRDPRAWASDLTPAFLLIVRTAIQRHTESELIDSLDRAIVSYTPRDYFCALRLKLVRAEALTRSAPEEARVVCSELIELGSTRGLFAIENEARAVLRKVERRLRNGPI